MTQSDLYHTYPLVCLDSMLSNTPVFIEAHPCLQSPLYLNHFLAGDYKSILDCGVGASPDLKDPMAHVQGDPSFGVKYLCLMQDIEPTVMVIPDVLGDADATFENYLIYTRILDSWTFSWQPELMYVIQGKTVEEATEKIKIVCNQPNISWIGFPRIVHYYGCEDVLILSDERMYFINSQLDVIKEKNKKIHLLGCNNLLELIWCAKNNFSMDTRLATLAAVNNFDVTLNRPRQTINVDLCEYYNDETIEKILRNIQKLNEIYYGETP
jgi:hypothetical protein